MSTFCNSVCRDDCSVAHSYQTFRAKRNKYYASREGDRNNEQYSNRIMLLCKFEYESRITEQKCNIAEGQNRLARLLYFVGVPQQDSLKFSVRVLCKFAKNLISKLNLSSKNCVTLILARKQSFPASIGTTHYSIFRGV